MSAGTLVSPRPGGDSFREGWLITLGHMLTHWYPATFYLLLPLIGNELGLSYSQIGLIITSQALAQAVANIPGGMVVDTIGRKGLLMAVSLFWVGFPYLLMGFTHSYLMLLSCVALVGFGNSIWHPTALSALADKYPTRKGWALSIHSMGGNVGDALAPVAIGALLVAFTWREVVMINVVPGLVIALLLLAFMGTLRLGASTRKTVEAPAQSVAAYMQGLRDLVRNRSVLLLSIGSAFRSMTQNGLLTFLPLYLANEMGYSPLWVGGAMFVLQAAGFAATPFAGRMSDAMGPRRIVSVTMAMTAVVLVFMALAGRSPFFIAFIALLGFFLYATRPVIHAWLLDCVPSSMAGSSIGIMFMAQAIGGSVGPLAGGMLADQYGLVAAFYFLAATVVAGNLFVVMMPRERAASA